LGFRDRLKKTESGRDVFGIMMSKRLIQKIRKFLGYRERNEKEAEEREYLEKQLRDFYKWRMK
jgi:hypothetical protein